MLARMSLLVRWFEPTDGEQAGSPLPRQSAGPAVNPICDFCQTPRYLGVGSQIRCAVFPATTGAFLSSPKYPEVFREAFTVLMIRLARVGARKQPHYRVVVIEKDRARNGRSVEVVGTYNPRTNPASVELKRERIDYWRSKGAQVSSRVGKILGFAAAVATPTA